MGFLKKLFKSSMSLDPAKTLMKKGKKKAGIAVGEPNGTPGTGSRFRGANLHPSIDRNSTAYKNAMSRNASRGEADDGDGAGRGLRRRGPGSPWGKIIDPNKGGRRPAPPGGRVGIEPPHILNPKPPLGSRKPGSGRVGIEPPSILNPPTQPAPPRTPKPGSGRVVPSRNAARLSKRKPR